MKKISLFFVLISFVFCSFIYGQAIWTPKATLPDTGRQCMATFVIGTKAFVVAGTYLSGYSKQFWEYDAITDVWTRKKDFPGSARFSPTGFAIGNKGYVCGGTGGSSGPICYSDLWEYDLILDSWTSKAAFPGIARDAAFGFTIGSKGYIGTGRPISGPFLNDLWEYNPSTNIWTALPNVPGPPRCFAMGFAINNKGYIGGGFKAGGTILTDLYEFDPIGNVWVTKSPSGFAAAQAASFVLGNKGFIAGGYISGFNYSSDLWVYDPGSNTYTKIDSFPGGKRCNTNGFSVGGKGYVGFGVDSAGTFPNDLYEYDPRDKTLFVSESNVTRSNSIYPNPSSGIFNIKGEFTKAKICIYDVLGNCVSNKNYKNESPEIDLSHEPNGIYFVKVINDNQQQIFKMIKQ